MNKFNDIWVDPSEKKRKKNIIIIRHISLIVSVLAIFIFSINISATVASSSSKILGLKNFVNLVNFNKNMKKTVENNFVQPINKSAESKNIKFTVRDVVIDKKNMAIRYEIKTLKKKYKDLNVFLDDSFIEITGDKNKKKIGLVEVDNLHDEKFKEKGKKEGVISTRFNDMDKIPESITLNLKKIKQTQDDYCNDNGCTENIVQGDWTVKFNVDPKCVNTQRNYYPINKNINIGGVNILIKEGEIYPTCGEMKFDLRNNKDYKFVGFVNERLVDDKGKEYKSTGGRCSLDNSERTAIFESSYLTKTKKLYFKADGVLFIPKKDMYITVDIKNKKIIDDAGFDIEFMDGRFENENNKKIYKLSFKIKDKEILKMSKFPYAKMGGIGYSEIYDEKNHKYNINTQFASNPYKDLNQEEYMESGIGISGITVEPEILKLKVEYANKGVLQKINIRIK